MVKLYEDGIYLRGGSEVVPAAEAAERGITQTPEDAKRGTIAYSILQAHNTSGDPEALKIRFDAMASHDITFVGIIQTARASGMEQFPLPYVLTNCHNSLCAVGGTINEDDHVFGLSAAKKYGGIFVPPHIAVIHSFMRENFAGCGKMILGSDSHTRYGALGTIAVGEGGGELAKQLLRDTYDVAYPGVVAIYLTGAPRPGVGPHDVALAIIRAVFAKGYVKNRVMEFVGPGIASMTTDYRNGVDVMTTETTCLSSIWATDEDTRAFLTMHGRGDDYRELKPADVAYYDGCVEVDLSSIKPMIALPFHPSNGFEIDELNENLEDILHEVELEAAKIGEGTLACSTRSSTASCTCSRALSPAARAATTTPWSRLPACSRAPTPAAASSRCRSTPRASPWRSSLHAAATSTTLWRPARLCARHSAARASALATRLPTTAFRFATPRAISPTARVPSRVMAS